MDDNLKEILKNFINKIQEVGDYTEAGVNNAFEKFKKSLTIHKHVPEPGPKHTAGYINTTIEEAITNAKRPIYIPVKKNEYGNIECAVYPGLLVRDVGENTGVVYGIQDGENIVSLSMNQIRICMANGWRYDGENLVGSAKTTYNELRTDPK
jgi:hypothetical protein